MRPEIVRRLGRPAALVLLIGGVLALGGRDAAWATPAERPGGQTIPTLTPGGQTPTQVPTTTPVPTISAGALPTPRAPRGDDTEDAGSLEIHRIDQSAVPPLPSGYTLIGQALELVLVDAQGNPIQQASRASADAICFNYTDADLALAGGDASNLIVQHYDTNLAAPAWVDMHATLSQAQHKLCVSTTRLGLFTLASASTGGQLLASGVTNNQPAGASKLLATKLPARQGSLIWLLTALSNWAALTLRARRLIRLGVV